MQTFLGSQRRNSYLLLSVPPLRAMVCPRASFVHPFDQRFPEEPFPTYIPCVLRRVDMGEEVVSPFLRQRPRTSPSPVSVGGPPAATGTRLFRTKTPKDSYRFPACPVSGGHTDASCLERFGDSANCVISLRFRKACPTTLGHPRHPRTYYTLTNGYFLFITFRVHVCIFIFTYK